MSEKELDVSVSNQFLENVSAVLTQARKAAKTAVNLSMVYAYFEIGRMIIEEEQHGQNRAAYGKQILRELSDYLTHSYGKGFSVGNLKNMRQFYKVYASDQIGETVFSQFENLPMVDTGRRFFLICTLWIMMIFEFELDGLRVSLLILTNSDLVLLLPDFVYCYLEWIGYNRGNRNSHTSQ